MDASLTLSQRLRSSGGDEESQEIRYMSSLLAIEAHWTS